MPQPYLKPIMEVVVLRHPIFRDDNFKDGWSRFEGDVSSTFTSNGDIATLTPGTGASWAKNVAGSVSTTTYPRGILRARRVSGTGNVRMRVRYTDLSIQDLTPITSSAFTITDDLLTSGKTVQNVMVKCDSGTVGEFDFPTICKDTPLQLHANDLVSASATRATSSVDEFTLTVNNKSGVNLTKLAFPSASTDRLHTVYIWMGYQGDDTLTRTLYRVFGGTLEELTPSLSRQGDVLELHGPGWAKPLLNVLITKDYGSQSDNPTLDTPPKMVDDIIAASVNASGTGYQLTRSYMQTGGSAHAYILFKQEKAFDAIKHVLDIALALGSNWQFWVDSSENAHLAPIDNWGTDPSSVNYPNALNVGRDQIVNNFPKGITHLRNQVRYVGGIRKPANRDYWTETVASSDWEFQVGGVGGSSSVSYDAGTFKVNAKAIKGNWSGQSTGSSTVILRYPSGFTLGLDITKLGGKITPPHLIYFAKSSNTRWTAAVDFETSSGNAFTSQLHPGTTVAEGWNSSDWQLVDIPFGPYGESTIVTGSPSWSDIQRLSFNFHFDAQKTSGDVWVDGLHIAGQIGFIQKDSTRINQTYLREHSTSDPSVREETAHRDLALAELKRLRNVVLRGTIRVPGIPDILPGQRITVTAPSANLSAATLRILEVRHSYSKSGFTTELDLTDDLTNYQSLSPISLAKLLTTQDMPGYRKKEEHDVAMEELDPTITFTTIDNSS